MRKKKKKKRGAISSRQAPQRTLSTCRQKRIPKAEDHISFTYLYAYLGPRINTNMFFNNLWSSYMPFCIYIPYLNATLLPSLINVTLGIVNFPCLSLPLQIYNHYQVGRARKPFFKKKNLIKKVFFGSVVFGLLVLTVAGFGLLIGCI